MTQDTEELMTVASGELSDRDKAVLDLVDQLAGSAGHREEQIDQALQMRATSYYQTLNRLIDQPAAEFYRPELVRRLRDIRQRRTEARRAPSSVRGV